MRIVSPVRLSCELGDQLTSEVSRTREILEEFQKGGFERALWPVENLPAAIKDIEPWTQTCLKAFPEKPILALDLPLEGEETGPSPVRLKEFLERILPHVHSVVLNWEKVNNYEQRTGLDKGIRTVRETARRVRTVSPKTFLWLRVDDNVEVLGDIRDWVNPLADSVDGYWLERPHEWNAPNHAAYAKAAESLPASGKPVFRGGFRYSATRVRPALRQAMAENYAARMPVYEKWIEAGRYAGYSRAVGEAIPGRMQPTQTYTGE